MSVVEKTAIFELARDVVLACGEETIGYVHSQVSQDVDDMAVGESRLTFLLQPQGKVDALLRLTRTGDTELVLDTDAGFGEAMTASLERFKLRTKVDFEPLNWKVVSVFGEVADELVEGTSMVVPGLLGASTDLLGEAPMIAGATAMSADEYERLRVLATFPRVGVDLEEGSIPNESGLIDRAVSFTKGCYRGQELVERIHSRGGNRRVLQTLDVVGFPVVGAKVIAGDREVGSVTSAVDGHVMAYVRGDVDAAEELVVSWSDAGRDTRVAATRS